MARVPISFYLNILAGIIVLFNHYAASETGDIALNKVTGAADRFYALFRDTALTLQHGCVSRVEMALCGPIMDSILPHGAAKYLRIKVHCHHPPAQDSESVGGTSNDWQGYGGSDVVFVYSQPHMQPFIPRTFAEGPLGGSFNLDWSSQSRLSESIWDRSNEVMATVGALLLRTCASWWWFRAPLKVTSFLLATYSVVSTLDYLFGASVVVQCVAQLYIVVMADFLQCIEWEARRQVLELIGVMMAERTCGFAGVTAYARSHTQRNTWLRGFSK